MWRGREGCGEMVVAVSGSMTSKEGQQVKGAEHSQDCLVAWQLPHLVYCKVGVWADDSATAKVNALATQVAAKAPLLALEPLHKASAVGDTCGCVSVCKDRQGIMIFWPSAETEETGCYE